MVDVRYVSTGGSAPRTDLRTALFRGLAPDGGLYMPQPLVPFTQRELDALRGGPLRQTAVAVGERLLDGGLSTEMLEAVWQDGLNFPIPLIELSERVFVLEVFHGPTLAFKDVGARCMARLMAKLARTEGQSLTVLVATSGDTGGAVAHAFYGLAGTRVVVLFPEGQVSPFQEQQFTTLGGNVIAVAVQGTFDDCQRLAKEALANDALRSELRLTSANSINVGRLLPQVCYFVHAWAQLPPGAGRLIVSVPSGNFGNLTAGLLAKRLGVPIDRFVAATNVNDVVPDYLETGTFEPRPSVRTISNAMDVGNPSNFPRMLALYGGDWGAMRRDVIGHTSDDAETRACIARVHDRFGYVVDPHSAVGLLGLETAVGEHAAAAGIVVATAHPCKFAEVVEPVIGRAIEPPAWYAMPDTARRDVARIRGSLNELVAIL
ncbi:MAG: threonine synthase [Gemmatimonadota bacterium]|nr:threonine synthase [Gemmatimonadota bacterium]